MKTDKRYILIAEYPESPYDLNDILKLEEPETSDDWEAYRNISKPNALLNFFISPDKYPHLFRELKWWEHREPKDMPRYLKDDYEGKVTKVVEVENWLYEDGEMMFMVKNSVHYICMVNTRYSPATEKEYYSFYN